VTLPAYRRRDCTASLRPRARLPGVPRRAARTPPPRQHGL